MLLPSISVKIQQENRLKYIILYLIRVLSLILCRFFMFRIPENHIFSLNDHTFKQISQKKLYRTNVGDYLIFFIYCNTCRQRHRHSLAQTHMHKHKARTLFTQMCIEIICKPWYFILLMYSSLYTTINFLTHPIICSLPHFSLTAFLLYQSRLFFTLPFCLCFCNTLTLLPANTL